MKDSGGTLNGGKDSVTNTFSIGVTPVNDAPTVSATGGSVDTREELHAVIPGPLPGRTRQVYDAVDLGAPLNGAASVGCILTRAQRVAPPP